MGHGSGGSDNQGRRGEASPPLPRGEQRHCDTTGGADLDQAGNAFALSLEQPSQQMSLESLPAVLGRAACLVRCDD